MTLDQAAHAIGRSVVYHDPNWPSDRCEEGVITSTNSMWVFVRYGLTGAGAATKPEHLEFVGTQTPRVAGD